MTGDLFITIQQTDQTYRYHIEFQTMQDQLMAIRMFRYGFEKAMELAGFTQETNMIIEYPKQRVIFIEENENITDQLSFILR